MGLLRKKYAVFNAVKSIKNEMKIYQKSIIRRYGHEKRFYKILKMRFLNDLASPNASISTRSVSHNNKSKIRRSQLND